MRAQEFCAALAEQRGLALVQMVTPVTPPERLAKARGRQSGIRLRGDDDRHHRQECRRCQPTWPSYLERVRAAASVPVCAGFGIRTREQVEALRGMVDGVVVGSALVEVLERGEPAQPWLASLRPGR